MACFCFTAILATSPQYQRDLTTELTCSIGCIGCDGEQSVGKSEGENLGVSSNGECAFGIGFRSLGKGSIGRTEVGAAADCFVRVVGHRCRGLGFGVLEELSELAASASVACHRAGGKTPKSVDHSLSLSHCPPWEILEGYSRWWESVKVTVRVLGNSCSGPQSDV